MDYVVYFSNAGAPATGLTPAVAVYKKVSDGADVGSPPAVTEIGGGFYKFAATPAEPLVVLVDGGTGLAAADRCKVMQVTPHDADLDAVVSSRSTLTAQQVWEYASRTLTGFGTLAADLWAHATRTLTAGTRDAEIDAIRAKTDNLPAAPADEDNLEAHVAAALANYDPPTRAEAAADRDAVLAQVDASEVKIEAIGAAIEALNDVTVGELLAGDLSDALAFPVHSVADLLRKIFWTLCNRLVIDDASGAFTGYKNDGVSPAVTGTIAADGTTTERSGPTWP